MDVKKRIHYEVSLSMEDVNKINRHITYIRRDEATGEDLIQDVEKMVALAYVTGVREGKMDIEELVE